MITKIQKTFWKTSDGVEHLGEIEARAHEATIQIARTLTKHLNFVDECYGNPRKVAQVVIRHRDALRRIFDQFDAGTLGNEDLGDIDGH